MSATLKVLKFVDEGGAGVVPTSILLALKIKTSDGEVHGLAGFTQRGDRVDGWLGPSESDPIPIALELKGDKLTIWTHPPPGRNVVFAKCEVNVKSDKMTRTIDADKGTIEFTRISHNPPKPVKFKPGF